MAHYLTAFLSPQVAAWLIKEVHKVPDEKAVEMLEKCQQYATPIFIGDLTPEVRRILAWDPKAVTVEVTESQSLWSFLEEEEVPLDDKLQVLDSGPPMRFFSGPKAQQVDVWR